MAPLRIRYTLLIPTYNRPAHLRSLPGYLAARRFQYPVRVLDSSLGDAVMKTGRQSAGEVIEHVGPFQNQTQLVAECARVARRSFHHPIPVVSN